MAPTCDVLATVYNRFKNFFTFYVFNDYYTVNHKNVAVYF